MPKVTAEEAREQLRLLYQGWVSAVGAVKDRAFLDRHLDEGWRYTDFNGTQRGKEEYLELVDDIVWYKQEMRQLDVLLAGEDVAIVTGVYHALAELAGGFHGDNVIAFSGVWQLRGGVWKALLHHTTKVAAAA